MRFPLYIPLSVCPVSTFDIVKCSAIVAEAHVVHLDDLEPHSVGGHHGCVRVLGGQVLGVHHGVCQRVGVQGHVGRLGDPETLGYVQVLGGRGPVGTYFDAICRHKGFCSDMQRKGICCDMQRDRDFSDMQRDRVCSYSAYRIL